MKHILFLTWKDIKHPRKWWAEVVMYEYAKRLVQDWNKVTWFASNFSWWLENENIDGINIVRKYSINSIYFFAVFWYKKFIKSNKVDLIIDEAWWIPLLSPLYEKNIPIYFFIHHVWEDEYEKSFFFPLNKIFKKFVYYTFSLYKNYPIITVSNSTKLDLKEKFNFDNVFVIENTSNIDPIKDLNFSEKKDEIVFLWRLTEIKRVEDAIFAFENFYKNNNSYVLNIIWNKQDLKYFNYLEKIVKEKNLDKIINFIEYSKENVKKILTRAKIMLVTSKKEGFWLVVLESNSFWLPVIAYKVPWLKDSVKNWINWYLVEDWDYLEMWNKIGEILNNNELFQKISLSSLEYIKKYGTWDDKYKEFKNIINL